MEVRMANITNKEFVEKICAETWKELYRFVYYKVQNREEAEDITQETYAKAISYFDRNDIQILEYSSYLKSISMNLIRDRWRARKRHLEPVNIDDVYLEEAAIGDFAGEIGERLRMEEAMSRLTSGHQKVIELRILKGYSVAETAKLMNKKDGTIRVLQFRAVKALAKLLEETQGKEECF
jgi:RNA polymerase sigma-70 factor (ECF subfamily)